MTDRQRRAAKILQANPKLTMGEVMRRAGYSDHTADTPGQLTNTKGWELLMEKFYPDEKVETVLQQALDANKTISTVSGKAANGGTVDFVDVPDWATRIDAVKEIHKIKGKYPASKTDITSNGEQIIPILGGSLVPDNNRHKEITDAQEAN